MRWELSPRDEGGSTRKYREPSVLVALVAGLLGWLKSDISEAGRISPVRLDQEFHGHVAPNEPAAAVAVVIRGDARGEKIIVREPLRPVPLVEAPCVIIGLVLFRRLPATDFLGHPVRDAKQVSAQLAVVIVGVEADLEAPELTPCIRLWGGFGVVVSNGRILRWRTHWS